jgi:hypothetical protein
VLQKFVSIVGQVYLEQALSLFGARQANIYLSGLILGGEV